MFSCEHVDAQVFEIEEEKEERERRPWCSRAVIPVSRNSGTRSAVHLLVLQLLRRFPRRAHLRFVAKAEETCARRIRFDKIVSVFTSLPPSLVVSLVTSVTIIASLCNLVELIAGFFSFSSRDKREKEKLVEVSLRLRSYICLLFLLVKFEILIGLEFSVLPKNFYTVPESITRKEC